jgi:hypothetical protein
VQLDRLQHGDAALDLVTARHGVEAAVIDLLSEVAAAA